MNQQSGETAVPDPSPDLRADYRDPDVVMRLSRMGSAHPTRLSFLRVLLRQMTSGKWRFDRPQWDIDSNGVGRAVYRAQGPDRSYSLVAFAHDLPDDMRSDRVIATAWDATFALFDGEPTAEDVDRLSQNVPLQEAGRITPRELCLSRANRSVRLFAHVIDRLSRGDQPDPDEVASVGYLMRTTAVYGSGKFGAADRTMIAERPELMVPFQAEMLSVWLIRQFTVDIVEHLAQARGGAKAAKLDPSIKQSLGVGNSTGLGMAPFLVRHPVLLNNWMTVREEALARVRALADATPAALSDLRRAFADAVRNADLWRSDHPIQIAKLADLRGDLARIGARIGDMARPRPWDRLWRWGEDALTTEGQEALLALMLEPHGDIIDGLADCMAADEGFFFGIDGAITTGALRAVLKDRYGWALALDWTDPATVARFWYVSEEKLEPRIGVRSEDAGAELEQPLNVARMAHDLACTLDRYPDTTPTAELLLAHPEHRYIARRAQTSARLPYAEVRDNLTSAEVLPIDLMRCKLAFFGATHFDPRSDKWVRISLFQGAPYPLDLPKGAPQ